MAQGFCNQIPTLFGSRDCVLARLWAYASCSNDIEVHGRCTSDVAVFVIGFITHTSWNAPSILPFIIDPTP